MKIKKEKQQSRREMGTGERKKNPDTSVLRVDSLDLLS